MHSEGHAVAHLIGVLPIPGDFARPGIQVISPHVVIYSPVPSALAVLILKEADYTCGKLKEELNCEEECNHRHCDATYVKEKTHTTFQLHITASPYGTGQPSVRGEVQRPTLPGHHLCGWRQELPSIPGSKTKVLGPNSTHCLFLQIKFYWNTAPPTHLLLSRAGFALKPQSSAVVTQSVWPGKLKIFSLWSFTEVCQPLFYTRDHIQCLPPSSLPVLGPDKSSKKNVCSALSSWKPSPFLSTWQKPPPTVPTTVRGSFFRATSNSCTSIHLLNVSPSLCYKLHGGRFLPYLTLTRQETLSGTGHNYSINISQMNEFHC